MRDSLLVGVGPLLLPVPRPVWRRVFARTAAGLARIARSVGPDGAAVRDAAVLELARGRGPVAPAALAARTGLTEPKVRAALADLERRLVYLVRDPAGAVEWAFPFSAAATPHRLVFADGEEAGPA